MRRALIDPRNSLWRNALGVVAAIILIPLVIIVKLITMPFERPHTWPPEKVAAYIRDFLAGTGSEWDWDDFISASLADPDLEKICQRAARVELPLSDKGRATLSALLAEAEAMAGR